MLMQVTQGPFIGNIVFKLFIVKIPINRAIVSIRSYSEVTVMVRFVYRVFRGLISTLVTRYCLFICFNKVFGYCCNLYKYAGYSVIFPLCGCIVVDFSSDHFRELRFHLKILYYAFIFCNSRDFSCSRNFL